jgi:hemoglobin
MSQTLYEKYGGKKTVGQIVVNFYQKVMADESLKKFFTNTDMKVLISHQTNFISQALGGPKEYTGLDMKAAHQGMNISQSDFNAVAGHLKNTLEELNVEAQDIDTIIGVVAPLSEHIVSKQ